MKQILQNLKSGETALEKIPCPRLRPGHLLIRTTTSLVSVGTEGMMVEFGKANLLAKVRQQPEKAKRVLDKVKTDGLMPALEAVRSKLGLSVPLGYSNVGTVMEVGTGVDRFKVGDRVVSNGKHAEAVCVPKNLCAAVPENVSDEAAAFTVIGAVALQGIRLGKPTLGEAVVVTGLGLVGQMAVQLLRANGCRVMGIDLDEKKCAIARRFGATTVNLSRDEDPLAAARSFSRGRGADMVLIAASTRSSEPLHQAALMCRKRGRLVLVGSTGMELSRADFYEKELSFQVSCSYGPGRYDPDYEEQGQDYPYGLVRWTEQRNFEAVLDMLADGRLDVTPLVSHRVPLEKASEAYQLVGGGQAMGIVLNYADGNVHPDSLLCQRTLRLDDDKSAKRDATAPVVGFIGSGNYANRVLIPAFKATRAVLKTVVSRTGISGTLAGRKYGFAESSTDAGAVIADPRIDALVIAAPRNSHARYVIQALEAGKHVFVEKPLCFTRPELEAIERTYRQVRDDGRAPLLMVGFNRRFAPQSLKIKELLGALAEPKAFVMTVNAGAPALTLSAGKRRVGGGRLVDEGFHFIDLLRFLADSHIVGIQAAKLGKAPGALPSDDKVTFTLIFADGSHGTVHLLANGHKSFPRERLEVFCSGRVLQLDNFRKLTGFGWKGFGRMNLWRQDKGRKVCPAAFVSAIAAGGPSPIPFDELVEVTRAGFDIVDMLES